MAQAAREPAHEYVNDIDIDELKESVATVKQTPHLARFQFRAVNDWVAGGRTQSTISGFYGGGHEDRSRCQPYVVTADEPQALLGTDQGPSPVEHLLHAVGACLTASLVYHAALRGIRIEAVETELKGDLDIRGFLDAAEAVRSGVQSIQVTMRVRGDAPDETLRELCRVAHQRSPVFDTVARGTLITVLAEAA